MSKVSLGKSSDPIQQQLRDEKAEWNAEVSALINSIIHMKKLINGSPSKYFAEKSSIKEEIPSNPIALIQQISSDYSEIGNKGIDIVKHQIEYAKNRRRPVKAEEQFELVSEASNKLTRFLSKLKRPWAPFFGSELEKDKKKYRLKLLSMFTDLYYLFKQLESNILSNDKEALVASGEVLKRINLTFDKITEHSVLYMQQLKLKQKQTIDQLSGKPVSEDKVEEFKEEEPKAAPEEIKDHKSEPFVDDDLESSLHDKLTKYIKGFIDTYDGVAKDDPQCYEIYLKNKYNPALVRAMDNWKAIPEFKRKSIKNMLPAIINFMEALPLFTDKPFEHLYQYNQFQFEPSRDEDFEIDKELVGKSARHLYTFKNKESFRNAPKEAFIISDIEKFADNIIEKQIKLLKHKLPLLKNDTSGTRIDIYDSCKKIREKINKVLDELEKSDFSDYESLIKFKETIDIELSLINTNLKLLGFDNNLNIAPINYREMFRLINNPRMYPELNQYSNEDIEKLERLEHQRKLRSLRY